MIKQTNSVQAKHAPLLSLFLNGYENMRQKMDAPCRRPLLEIAPLVFGKWYYAALAKETILSPANLFALDLQKDSDAKIEYAYIMNTKAAEEQSDLEFTSEYHFSLMTYSTQKHPLVADLQALIGYCTPDRATDENGMLLEEEKKEILAQLSLRAEFYLEYLTRLAWLHGLLVPMPSIHTRRVQPASECDAFFAQPTADILFQLGESACTLASERFIEAMDLEDGIAPPDFFYHLLESNQEVGRIFIDFYKRVDVDIEEIWRTPPEKLNAEERSIVSSFLFMGIMLDKWFLTPMSVFFRFIRPIAFTPMQFYPLVNTLASLILMEHNVGAELFTPPTYYSLTALGKEPLKETDFTPEIASTDFNGTLYSTSGIHWLAPDTIEYWVPEDDLRVTSWKSGKEEPGRLYDRSYLEHKDKYSSFLGGNQPLCVLENPAITDGSKLLLIRDSYSDSLAPFLAQRFSEVHLLDLRYYHASVADYMAEQGIDTAVVLYSVSNFLADRNLIYLAPRG